ncbi:hypothetical protein AMELA_G00052450, partial [Ameiurus melas]
NNCRDGLTLGARGKEIAPSPTAVPARSRQPRAGPRINRKGRHAGEDPPMPYRPGIGGSDERIPPLSNRMAEIKGHPSAPGKLSTDSPKRILVQRDGWMDGWMDIFVRLGRRRPRRHAALRDGSRTPRLLPGFPRHAPATVTACSLQHN